MIFLKKTLISRFLLMGFASCIMLSACNDDDQADPDPDPDLKDSQYTYMFNNGQVVPTAPYSGNHIDNLSANKEIVELSDGRTEITVTIYNTVEGATYSVHAHDAADPETTPNQTPYDETPNNEVFHQLAEGNGGTVSVSQTIEESYSEITEKYEGFFVIHDPLQNADHADITTFLVVGAFAREQPETNFTSASFNYDFNTGQLDSDYEYEGMHSGDLSAEVKIQELADDNSRVSVFLMNSLDGETYPVHAHDQADPSDTPNETPYDETPNGDVLALAMDGNGGTAHRSQISTMNYNDLINSYEGFFVVHDPLQGIDPADPTTFVILGVFAD